MAKAEPLRYKEVFQKSVYRKDYETTSENTGKTYPSNRIDISIYKYSGEYENQDKTENIAYKGVKIKVTNKKLELRDGEVSIKMKVVKDRAYEDGTTLLIKPDELTDLIEGLEIDDLVLDDEE